MRVPVIIELTQRKEQFVRALLKPTQAATMSGYAISTARYLLRKNHVRQAIKAVHRNATALVARFERQEIAGAK